MKCLDELPPPSGEQRAIVDAFMIDGCHVRVDAVAGSGKTTTILHMAEAMLPNGRLLVLTYNAKLKSETRQRCSQFGITNAAVHTYHSAALNIYCDPACSRDDGIARLLKHTPEKRPITNSKFTALVVDEAQDMTQLYFALTRKLLTDICVPNARVVVLGDTRQAIYGFKGADARFLSMSNRLPSYASTIRAWCNLSLTTSYRLAPRLACFVNSQLLQGEELLKSVTMTNKQKPKDKKGRGSGLGTVRYLRCNTFGELPFREIISWLNKGLEASDIFILAPSIRTNTRMSPLRMLENRLVREGLRCYAASSDDERLDEDVTRGKIVFATFHQVKGLERKAVMVFNFDASYHRFFERDLHGSGCPNAIYVAATRAKQHLTLLHDSKQGPLRTIRMASIHQDCEFVVDSSIYKGGSATTNPNKDQLDANISVTDLLRHQKQDVLLQALSCLSVRHYGDQGEGQAEDALDCNSLLKSKTSTGEDSWENVAAITGTAMPCMFEQRSCGRCTLLTRAALNSKSLPTADRVRIQDLQATNRQLTTADFLYIANVHMTVVGGFTHKLWQIKVYDWVQEGDVEAMMEVMERHVVGGPTQVHYEQPAALVINLPHCKRRVKLACAVDCLDESVGIAFEFKCVSVLSTEHILQTALNGLLLEQSQCQHVPHIQKHRHVLLNLCGGAALEVMLGLGREGGQGDAMRAAVLLLEAKYAAIKCADDETFLESVIVGADLTPTTLVAGRQHTDTDTNDDDTGDRDDANGGHSRAYAFMSDDDT